MGIISETTTWEATINQIETSDQLLGGATGPMNMGTKQLANRTNWLKQALQGYVGITTINSNHTLTKAEALFNLIQINASGAVITVMLPDSADPLNPIAVGFKIVFAATGVDTAQVAIICGGSDLLIDSQVTKTTVYLGDGDVLELVFTAAGWLMLPGRGNFDCVGDVELQYKQKRNTLIAQGQLVNRAAYPRLWEWVQTLGPSLVDDATWYAPGNKGFYSNGNGSTNFRLPDLRAMHLRALDLGAGIDYARQSEHPGGYEADALKSHSHFTVYNDDLVGSGHPSDQGRPVTATRSIIKDFGKTDSGGKESYDLAGTAADNIQPNISPTSKTGGDETLVKNIGLLPLIKV